MEEPVIIVTDPGKVVEKSIENHEILSSMVVVPE